MKIRPAHSIQGSLLLPGDKSISHRAAMLATLGTTRTTISNFATSEDCRSTVDCMRALGVKIEQQGTDLMIQGVGQAGFRPPAQFLNCGNSGSTMRLLAGLLAGHNLKVTMTGDPSLSRRPMDRVIEPLELMGARVTATGGRPPITIEGNAPLRALRYELPVASAQVKSCVLLAGLGADGRTEVVERGGRTRDHTERLLRWHGVPVDESEDESDRRIVSLVGPASITTRDVAVPGDISSAAFFVAAAALLPNSKLSIRETGLNPTRDAFLGVLQSLGAQIERVNVRERCNETVGDIKVRGTGRLSPPEPALVLRGPMIPLLIDELPLLAVIGTQIEGGLEIRDAAELRVKETDRIAATVENLRTMGGDVDEFEDGLAVKGPVQLHGTSLDSFGDHRIAMAFTIASLMADGESEISGTEYVAISFPEFFELLKSVTEN